MDNEREIKIEGIANWIEMMVTRSQEQELVLKDQQLLTSLQQFGPIDKNQEDKL